MKLQLDIPSYNPGFNVKHGDEALLMGSCFSDTMVPHFHENGFRALSNPFGTIFHPLALAKVIKDVLNENFDVQAVERNGIWFDWRCSDKISGNSQEELQQKFTESAQLFRDRLKKAKLLVVTFGTSWGYKNEGNIVANCHKMPQKIFAKELSDVDQMVGEWKEVLSLVHSLNSNLEIVFTVSPVRHVKDGIVANNRSKARLIELSHILAEKGGTYYPSYEIVTDVLRDYRFYKKDLVHPNDLAVTIVWEHFSNAIFEARTIEICNSFMKLKRMKQHNPRHPESKDNLQLKQQISDLESELRSEFPTSYFQ